MRLVAALAFALLATARPAAAQTRPLEPHLPADFSARSALIRLAGIGALPAADVIGAWPLSRNLVRRRLEQARADSTHSAAATLAAHLLGQLVVEAGDAPKAVWLSVGVGWSGYGRQLRAGRSLPVDSGMAYQGARLLRDARALSTQATLALNLSDDALLAVAVRDSVGDPRITELYASGRIGPILLRAGRIPLSLGVRGGFVLHAPPPFTGISLDVPDGFVPPSPFGGLGRVRVTHLISRLDRSGDIDDPWFAATRVSVAPSTSLVIGVQRAIILGGEGNEGVTVRRVALALIGITDAEGKDSDFENQVVSVDAFWKLPGRPVSLRGEWGLDDAGWSFLRVPAIALGADWHTLPFAPMLAAGVEVTYMAPPAAAHPPWYQHIGLGDGWSDDGRLLGHPLAGHGIEAALSVGGVSERIHANARIAWRDRGRFNLLAPTREGRAFGFETAATLYPSRPLFVQTRLAAERHERDGWAWRAAVLLNVAVAF